MTPIDQSVRDRLASEFDRNFLVEAGAGSGKTFSLAARMAAGIAAGVYRVERLTVVTFTRKAAAELRGRFQIALEKRLRGEAPEGEPTPAERERLEAALAGMERLVSGTIHSFCARLLRERPVDARIAPGFEELGEADDSSRRQQAWRDFIAAASARGWQPALDLFEAGVRPKDLYDAFCTVCEHEDVDIDMGAGNRPDPKPVWSEVDRLWKELCSLAPAGFHEATTCQVQQRFEEFEGRLRLARRERASSLASFLRALRSARVTQKYWGVEAGQPPEVGKRVKRLLDTFRAEVIEPFDARWKAYVHRLSMEVLAAGRDFYARDRRRQNVVNYVDLLSVTARMLGEKPLVRRALQRRYPFILVDEFQDTDPIQAEIFLMLAADESISPGGAETPGDGDPGDSFDPFTAALRPGALFVVGDPKQSIFRFRRADIDMYNRVAARIRETGGEVVNLTANFRSLPQVCDAANTVFPSLFAGHGLPYSPAFKKLDAVREVSGADPVRRDAGVWKMTIPEQCPGGRSHEEEESRRIAAYIRTEVSAGRRSYGDFLVLARQRPRLARFVEAFDDLDIPVDVSGAGLFCGSEEVRALAALLGALADPLDQVALAGVLRGPLFGHSDRELFRFRRAGGRFDLASPLPSQESESEAEDAGASWGAVLETMRRLKGMWRHTRRLPAGAAVARILEETGWLALAATTPGGAGAGRLLQAVDRVREVVERGGGLAEAAAALEEEEPSNEAEALPLEPGRRDVVRLMNLHKAKGLEAKVVFLADATHAFEFPIDFRAVRTQEGNQAPRGFLRIMRPASEPWRKTVLAEPLDWAEHEQEERKYRAAERIRLLYVAGTRAKDMLVVCRSAKASNNKAWDVFESYVESAPELDVREVKRAAKKARPDFSKATLESARAALGRRHEVARRHSWAATAVTGMTEPAAAREPKPGTEAAPAGRPAEDEGGLAPDPGSEPRGDAGISWGSLVHGLLEHAVQHPEATRADLERLARWLIVETPEVGRFVPRAIDLVEAVSRAPFWQDALAGGEAHVEVPFAVRLDPGTTAGGRPVELPTIVRGVIDLVYRSGPGWRIVDYKTMRVAVGERELLGRHRLQLEHYEHAWKRATGDEVVSLDIVRL